MALFLASTRVGLNFVASTDPDVVMIEHEPDDAPTRLVPVSLTKEHAGATVFRLRAIDGVTLLDVLGLEGIEQNAAICKAGLAAVDGSEADAAEWTPKDQPMLCALVARAIWALSTDPAAFARPTRPGPKTAPGS